MQKKRLFALILVLLMCISIAACGGDSSDKDTSSNDSSSNSSSEQNSSEDKEEIVKGGTLVYGHRMSVTSIDTTLVTNAGNQVFPAVEPLARTKIDCSYEYLLVEDMIRDDDALTLTLKIKKGVKFHDGSELTPEVVKWNIDRYIASPLAAQIGSPTKTEVNADGDVVVYYDSFSLDWEYLISSTFIYSKEYYDEHGEDCYNSWAVGTGPFKMISFVIDSKTVFEKFEDYHGEAPYLDKLIFIYFADSLGQVTAFINNEIGWVQVNENNYIEMCEKNGYERVNVKSSSSYTVNVTFNTTVGGPWAERNVREAVALWGLDYDTLTKTIVGENGYHNYQFALEGGLSYVAEKENLYHYDKEKALEMLSDAGYPDGFDTTLIAHTMHAVAAPAVQSALKDLGINASVDLIASSTTVVKEGTTPGIYLVTNGANMDPTKQFTATLGPTGTYMNCWSFNTKGEEIVNNILSARTKEDKNKALQDYVSYLSFDEVFWVPLYMSKDIQYVQDYIHNYVELVSEYGQFIPIGQIWMDGKLANT